MVVALIHWQAVELCVARRAVPGPPVEGRMVDRTLWLATAILARGPARETAGPTWAQIFPEARASHSTRGKSLHSTKYTRVGIGRHVGG